MRDRGLPSDPRTAERADAIAHLAGLVEGLPEGLQGLHGVGQDEDRMTHSCLHGGRLHVCSPSVVVVASAMFRWSLV
jgi:hypothetical protein